MRIRFRNRPIREVSTAEIALWNQGNEPIRMNDVTEQVKVFIHPKEPILAAMVVKTYGPSTQVTCDDKHFEEGIIPLSWNVLQKHDGAVIRLVYEGPPNVDIGLDGKVDNQVHPRGITFPSYKLPISKQVILIRKVQISISWHLLFISGMIVILIFTPPKTRYDKIYWCIIAGLIFVLSVLGGLHLLATAPPPFAL
jgi:hypothetical protein